MTPPVEMTKGRAALPATVVAEQDPFFIALGGPKAHDCSGEKWGLEGGRGGSPVLPQDGRANPGDTSDSLRSRHDSESVNIKAQTVIPVKQS